MGLKQSSVSNWTVDDWAFGTGENAVQIDEVVDEAKKMPAKYFGGEAIGNDPSMNKLQQDLLSFDTKLKRLFFRRKKNKRQTSSYEYSDPNQHYYDENEQYYDGYQPTIPEEDEYCSSDDHNRDKQQTTATNANSSSWRCRCCTSENASTDAECRQCKESQTKF